MLGTKDTKKMSFGKQRRCDMTNLVVMVNDWIYPISTDILSLAYRNRHGKHFVEMLCKCTQYHPYASQWPSLAFLGENRLNTITLFVNRSTDLFIIIIIVVFMLLPAYNWHKRHLHTSKIYAILIALPP